MLYSIIRRGLFVLDPEQSHTLALSALNLCHHLGLTSLLPKLPSQPLTLMGIDFPNPVGLAAGLDKNGDYIDALGALGFGFIEIGTVTPKPQPGNPKPRLFRLAKQGAIINRMGFNNKGVDYLIERVKASKYDGVLGINIGKNLTTSLEDAQSDYLIGLEKVYDHADYIVVNISSPNTKDLRQLQHGDSLLALLQALKQKQRQLASERGRYVPLVVKVSPDLSEAEVSAIAAEIVRQQLDGVIATNTTLSRAGVEQSKYANEQGGLSGAPLLSASNSVVKLFREKSDNGYALIGVGGVSGYQDALSKFEAGADLLQVYSGFIYRGPALVGDCLRAYNDWKQSDSKK